MFLCVSKFPKKMEKERRESFQNEGRGRPNVCVAVLKAVSFSQW